MIDEVKKAKPEDCLAGGGEMGALMRSLDWSKTLLGPVSSWPQSLRTAVSILLASRFPMLIHWGPELVQFYNDGFRPILGDLKHPGALGQPAYPWWTEIWDVLTPMFERVLSGEGTWYENQLILPNRNGYIEETYFTFSHSPIRDESGCVVGIFQAVTETTERVLDERRLRTLHDLGINTATAQVTQQACRIATETLSQNAADIPFALLYLLDESRRQAHLAGTAGLEPDTPASPGVIDLSAEDKPGSWPLARVARTGQTAQVDNLAAQFGTLPGGPWPESPFVALVLPVAQPGVTLPTGLLVVGISPRRALNDTYRRFLSLVAGQIATAVANTRALEMERKRAEALAELDRAKSQFLANMSHELRTPLNGILGYAQILKKGKTITDQQKSGLSIIHQCGEHLLNLINDVLDISKIEARKMELYPKNFHFPEFLEAIAEICRIRAEQKGIELIYETLTPIPKAVRADEKRLRQVLINLLGNAVKFTEQGYITFKLGYHQEKFRFQVEDTGIGIAKEKLEEIFLPFQQVGEKIRETEGTGLGLTISRELAELMGGELKVESTLGKGSVFWLDLDLPEVEWIDVADISENNIIGFKGLKRKILVVDDKWANRSVLVNMLEPLGFEVLEATDGLDGLNKAHQFQPDIIFMDLVMPVMDGFEATRRLRMMPELEGVVVIAISASVFDFDHQQSREVGCDGFLPKPVREADLLEKVRVHLGLEWVYEEIDTKVQLSSENSGLSTQDTLVVPPAQEVATLLDLAMRGDLKGIIQETTRLEELDQQWVPFATHLRQLAKSFKGKQIRQYLKNIKT
ncbi:response regulator [Tolypothrix campylonemoides VB511288]|nr:response regulator [Tolypothrix campylonemoides VB511288]